MIWTVMVILQSKNNRKIDEKIDRQINLQIDRLTGRQKYEQIN